MEIPTRKGLRDLIDAGHKGSVSIYMPTHLTPAEAVQDPIRLKNLLRAAESELVGRGRGHVEVRKLFEPAEALLTDDAFWRERSAGLAIFLAPGVFRVLRVPQPLAEAAIVDERFYLVPLLPYLSQEPESTSFYVLAVSQKHVRLMQGDRFGEHVVEVPELPKNLIESLNYWPPERMFQAHLFVRGPSGVRLESVHGQGGASDFGKEEILEYFRLIDKALHPVLRNSKWPLVFAGVDYLFPIYRQANSYAHLAQEHIQGGADRMNERELHDRALRVLQPHFDQAARDTLQHCVQRAGTQQDTCSLPAILHGAIEGRVDTLLLAQERDSGACSIR